MRGQKYTRRGEPKEKNTTEVKGKGKDKEELSTVSDTCAMLRKRAAVTRLPWSGDQEAAGSLSENSSGVGERRVDSRW